MDKNFKTSKIQEIQWFNSSMVQEIQNSIDHNSMDNKPMDHTLMEQI